MRLVEHQPDRDTFSHAEPNAEHVIIPDSNAEPNAEHFIIPDSNAEPDILTHCLHLVHALNHAEFDADG